MNKFKMLLILVFILLIAEGAGIAYFAYKSQELSKAAEYREPVYRKLSREKQALSKKYTELLNKVEGIEKDRDNVLAQAKRFVEEKKRSEELEVSLGESEAETELFKLERKEILEQSKGLKKEIEGLKNRQAEIEKSQKEIRRERDQLKEDYEKVKKGTAIRELENKVSLLQRENKDMLYTLKEERSTLNKKLQLAEKQLAKLKSSNHSLEKDVMDLREGLEAFRKNYRDAQRKNKILERETKNIPRKFSEIARQNRQLVKETAEMHYNLGVFYTKEKKYERAISEFAKTLEIDPENIYAHFNLGYIYAEHLVDREKAVEYFRHFLRRAKRGDKDADWVRKYILTWETYSLKKMEILPSP
ncbi:tetratricopeptide repeat protein [Candidatus Omnitrophota bacterium]